MSEIGQLQALSVFDMVLTKVNYSDLNGKQKEIYNFQKVSAKLADYGFNCIKLTDDWQGADFLAYHKDGNDTLKVQLKGRLTIEKKYEGKELYITFPIKERWCLIQHDKLIDLVASSTNWLNTLSWQDSGCYHSASPSKQLIELLQPYVL